MLGLSLRRLRPHTLFNSHETRRSLRRGYPGRLPRGHFHFGRVCFCSVLTMDKEEQRDASAAGLMVGIFILFLLTIGGFDLIALWPAIHFSGQ